MTSLIFRTITPVIVSVTMLFSIFVLLRGHNEPGGGFIGGLIAVAALSVYGIAFGVETVRRAIVFHPLSIAGAGLLLATLSGLVSMLFHVPFMTGLWVYPVVFGYEIPLSSVMTFDIGVYLVVVGAVTSIALSLEERGDD
ncbi:MULTISPECIES: Na(+)/H(+) antiporter subunit B [Rhizobium/Agrobacterium group]|uniref:Na(+)/H(+) antiporter subunit B n=1 Tax=Rhizobium/Agrobacterium group TaxID=227290 RepID=UPI000712365E|nr:Na(+)/H(+) antiporter subunit B [Rhizobium sp. Root483D2]KQY28383.1 cation:proton antiporter [Rhizobium sp. Root483D2]